MWVALVAVLLCPLVLRLCRPDAQTSWGDEAASYNFAKQDLSLVFEELGQPAFLVRPMYQERYLFITSPAYLLILAASLLVTPRHWTFRAGAAGSVGGGQNEDPS